MSSPATPEDGNSQPKSLVQQAQDLWASVKQIKVRSDRFLSETRQSVESSYELAREKVNYHLSLVDPAQVEVLDVRADLQKASIYINTHFPYFASLCRSHEALIYTGTWLSIAIPLSFISKSFAFKSALFGSIGSAGVVGVTKYKWANPEQK